MEVSILDGCIVSRWVHNMGAASAQTLQPQQLCASGPVLHFGHDTFAAPWLGFHLWDLLEVWGHWGGGLSGVPFSGCSWKMTGDILSDFGAIAWTGRGTAGVCAPYRVAGMLGELCWGPWKGEIFFLDTAFYT